ncbi:hypothetical protein EON65_46435 [archaeon]|nr:MAG: hypothetical protein EON65_46435 [archaeon]
MTDTSNVVEEARQVNSSLSRVQQTLSWTVHQTESTAQVLHDDDHTIRTALHDHKYELSGALKSTKSRLGRIQFAEKYEKLLMRIAGGLYTGVIIFILLSRFQIFTLIYMYFACGNNKEDKEHGEL